MFENELPAIPRLITMLAEWGTAAIFILLLDRRGSRLKKVAGIVLWRIIFFVVHYLSITYFQRSIMEMFTNMILCILLICCFIGSCAKVNICTALGYGAFTFTMAEFMASAEWFISALLFGADRSLHDPGPAVFLAGSFLLMFCGFFYLL